jgi:hypothetical protein
MKSHPPPSPLDLKLQRLLSNRQSNSTLRTLTLATPNQVDFSSNDFLSLSTNTALKTAFLNELQSKNVPLGSGGSRLLDGNSPYAEELEREIAAFHGAEAGLLFNSGFDANAGFFACVPQRGDVVVFDELIHASVHDGMRLSRAEKCLPFRHNCVDGLRGVLEGLVREEDGVLEGRVNVFVAVEAVYSMDGDVAPLREIVGLVEGLLKRRNGYVVVDEAHATGVLGTRGRGLVCELGLERRVFARLHTFGKAVACGGGKLFSLFLPPHIPCPLFRFPPQVFVCLRKESGDKANKTASNNPQFSNPKILPPQLRTPPNLHNLSLPPLSCRHKNLVHLPPTRSHNPSSNPLTVPHSYALHCTKRLTATIQGAFKDSRKVPKKSYFLDTAGRAEDACCVFAEKRNDGEGCGAAYGAGGDAESEGMFACWKYGRRGQEIGECYGRMVFEQFKGIKRCHGRGSDYKRWCGLCAAIVTSMGTA